MKVNPIYLQKQSFKAQENSVIAQENPVQARESESLSRFLDSIALINFAQVKKSLAFQAQKSDKIYDGNISVTFDAPANLYYNSMQKPFKAAVDKLQQLRKTDSNYSWIELPAKLLNENYVENVYSKINAFKKSNSKLIFVALGNPANTDEIVNAMGLGANFFSACDITPEQVNDTIKKAGGDLENIQVIISSKSGSTFESNQNYKILDTKFSEYYAKKGLNPEEVKKEVSKHFLFVTDKNPDKSKLKAKAEQDGIITIDTVDGLHSAFGDLAYSLPVLAYMGLSEESAKKMLQAADKTNKNLLSDDLNFNMAGKIAAFDKLAADKGATKEQFVFHDAHFGDFSKSIEQVYKESLRKLDFNTSVYPRAAHSGLEADLSRVLDEQKLNIITNVSVRNASQPQSPSYSLSAKNLDKAHEAKLKEEGHYQKNIELNLGENGITPESMGEFLQLKSYIVYFKNELENGGEFDLYNQDYVKGYKKILGELEFTEKVPFSSKL